MHSDLSPHLHTLECNELISQLKNCHNENKFVKFLGVCNKIDNQVVVCLRNERAERSRVNREKSKVQQLRIQERMKKLDKDEH